MLAAELLPGKHRCAWAEDAAEPAVTTAQRFLSSCHAKAAKTDTNATAAAGPAFGDGWSTDHAM